MNLSTVFGGKYLIGLNLRVTALLQPWKRHFTVISSALRVLIRNTFVESNAKLTVFKKNIVA